LDTFNPADLVSTQPKLSSLYPGGFLNESASECSEETDLLVMVFTAAVNREKRRAIRSYWASDASNSTRVLFLVGAANLTSDQITELEEENNQDVVFANFIDSYRNLTLKSVAMLDWAGANCKGCRFLLKCDDDMYINLKKLQNVLEERSADQTILGRLGHQWKPNRNPNSKYVMSVQEFAPEVLPDFMTGPAYVVSGQLIRPMFEAALKEHWIPLEDVFITGIVASQRLGVYLEASTDFVNERVPLTVCNAQKIAIHEVKPLEQKRLMERREKQCIKNKRQY
jgi:hypothetical protein